ncbi:MAG: lipoate--protein ligase family protein [Anaerolineales bacterium]
MDLYPPSTWRLIVHDARDGAWNMAADEAILTAVARADSPPTLRFYRWEPPCLSLGRAQPADDVDLAACDAAGITCVRRPTGGRAILHRDELTYSIALPLDDPRAAGDILESYRRLSEGLAEGLRALGVPVERAAPAKAPADATPACFETLAGYEITVGGRKLMGSAQFRTSKALLQHGSLPLCGDLAGIVDFLALPEAEREALRQRLRATAITLEQALARPVSFAEAAQALAQGLACALHVRLAEADLSPQEAELARRLRSEKYGDIRWHAARRAEADRHPVGAVP